MTISIRGRAALALPALLLAAMASASGANRFAVPDVSVAQGSSANRLDVRCEHDEPILAYALRLRFDPTEIRITSLTTAGTDAESFEFSNGFHDDVTGEIVFGAVADQSAPLDRVLDAGSHSLLRIVFDVSAPEGTSSAVDFVPPGAPVPPGRVVHENVLVVRNDVGGDERRVVDLLEGGQVRVGAPAPLADAGADALRPELERITLDASASVSRAAQPLSFLWRQVSGPPAQDVAGETEPRLELTLPPVVGDTELTFAVEVRDSVGVARDEVQVTAIDMDLRRARVSSAPAEARWLEAERRATVFAGALTWISAAEDGLWTAIRFTPGGDPVAHERVRAATLYLDTDGDDDVGPDDEQLDRIGAISAPDEPLEFAFGHDLRDGERNGFVLVVDLARETDDTDGGDELVAAEALLPPIALVLALSACAIAVAVRIRRFLWRYELAALIAAGALLGVLPAACSSGGGGSDSPAAATTVTAPPTSAVRYDVRDTDVDVTGRDTGVRVPVEGAPIEGATLEL